MLIRYKRNLFLAIMCCGLMAACSVATDIEGTIEQDVETAISVKERAKAPDKKLHMDTVNVREDIWLGNKSMTASNGDPLPKALEKGDGVTAVSNRPISLYEIADLLTKITGISTRISDELLEDALAVAEENSPSSSKVNADWTEPDKMLVSYSGNLSGFLDLVSNRFSIWWKYSHEEITFFRHETRSFTLYSLPTKPSINASVGGSSSGEGGGTSLSLESSAEIDFWENIDESVKSILGEESSYTVDSSNGVINVTATPPEIRDIAKFVDEHNRRLGRQVAINVKVLQVTLKDEDSYGLDLNAAFNDGTTDLKYLSPFTAGTDQPGLSWGIVDATNKWDGSGSVIEAISTQGDTSLVTSSSVTTLNNKPAPVQVTKKQNYISSITKTNTGTEGNYDISTETQELETGFTMEVLPRILDHGRMLLMFNLTLTEFVSLVKENIGTDGNFIQLPEVETRGFSQEIAMKSGQSLILSGYEKMKNSLDKSGLGSADNTSLGGNVAAERARDILVIILTPTVLESPLSPENRMRMM